MANQPGIEKMRAAQAIKQKYPELYKKIQPFYDKLTIQQIQRIAYNGQKGFDIVLREVKKANPKRDNIKLGGAKVPVKPGSDWEGYDPEVAKEAAMRNRAPKPAPATGGVLQSISESNSEELKRARTRLENRAPSPTKFLTDQDIKDLAIVKKYDEPFYRQVRHNRSDIYKKFSDLLGEYRAEIQKIADSRFPEGGSERDKFYNKYHWERGHLIPKSTQPHNRDVNSNISGESAARNTQSKATFTFGDMVNYMERGRSNMPVRRPNEWTELNGLLKQLESEGYNTRNLRRIRDDFALGYPLLEPVISKRSEIGNIEIIDRNGNPKSFDWMYNGGELSPNKDEARGQYERLRRLAITMMAENPEWDLNGMLATRKIPDSFLNGVEVDPNLGRKVSLQEIAEGNANVGEGMFRTRAGAANALKAGGGKLGAALTLLAASGAAFAADEDPNDESTWSEATKNRVINALEIVGQWEQQGMQAIQQGIPGAKQVREAYNTGIDWLNWGKGQDTSAPVVYDESGQPTGGGSWNASKGAGDYIDFIRQFVVPVEDVAIGLGALQPEFTVPEEQYSP